MQFFKSLGEGRIMTEHLQSRAKNSVGTPHFDLAGAAMDTDMHIDALEAQSRVGTKQQR